MKPRATFRIARHPDNRVTSCCTWCGATSPRSWEATVHRWQRVHSCHTPKTPSKETSDVRS